MNSSVFERTFKAMVSVVVLLAPCAWAEDARVMAEGQSAEGPIQVIQYSGYKYPFVRVPKGTLPDPASAPNKAKPSGRARVPSGGYVADHILIELSSPNVRASLLNELQKLYKGVDIVKQDGSKRLYFVTGFDGADIPLFEKIYDFLKKHRAVSAVSRDYITTLSPLQLKSETDQDPDSQDNSSARPASRLPNDPAVTPQLSWGIFDINAPQAWNREICRNEVKVGIIDSGVDYTHPELRDNNWINPGEIAGNNQDDDGNGYIDDVRGYNFADNYNYADPMDQFFHGTHVAGIVAAMGNNGVGIAGVCWRASIVPIRALDSHGVGYDSDFAKAIDYGIAVGVKVLNNSYGGQDDLKPNDPFKKNSVLGAAIQRANERGILFVAAAGNDGADNDQELRGRPIKHTYPSDYDFPNVLSVAAVTKLHKLAKFSNYGKKSVDIAAPGVSILSTMPTYLTKIMERFGILYNLNVDYSYLQGTSMAAPYVAGAAAMAWSHDPSLSVSDVKTLILNSSQKISHLNGKVVSGGKLDLERMIDLLESGQSKDTPFQLSVKDVTLRDSATAPPLENLSPRTVIGSGGKPFVKKDTSLFLSFQNIGTLSNSQEIPLLIQIEAPARGVKIGQFQPPLNPNAPFSSSIKVSIPLLDKREEGQRRISAVGITQDLKKPARILVKVYRNDQKINYSKPDLVKEFSVVP